MNTPAEIGNQIEALRFKSDELQRQAFAAGQPELGFTMAREVDQKMFDLVPALAAAEAKTPEDVIAKLEAIQTQLALLEMSSDHEAVDTACRTIDRLVATSLDAMLTIKLGHARYLNTKEAAQYLRYTPGTLENWRVNGGGPRFMRAPGKKRGPVRYAVEELDRWIQTCTFQSTTEAQNTGATRKARR